MVQDNNGSARVYKILAGKHPIDGYFLAVGKGANVPAAVWGAEYPRQDVAYF